MMCSTIRGVHEHLRAAALLALTKLMAVTSSYCDANLQLVFTLLHTRWTIRPYAQVVVATSAAQRTQTSTVHMCALLPNWDAHASFPYRSLACACLLGWTARRRLQ